MNIHELPRFSYAGFHDSRVKVTFHRHGGSEMVLALRGTLTVTGTRGELQLTPGQIAVIPPGLPHSQRDSADAANLYCVFQVEPELFDTSWRRIDVRRETWCRKLLHALLRMTDGNDDAGCDGILYTLLVRLQQLERNRHLNRHCAPPLQTALEYLEHHYREPVSMTEVVARSGVCPSRLRELFREYCGASPVAYLQKLRLAHAKKLLRNSSLSVKEVADRCGFERSNYFIRLYRRFYGTPPGRDRSNFRDTTIPPASEDGKND